MGPSSSLGSVTGPVTLFTPQASLGPGQGCGFSLPQDSPSPGSK